LSFSVHGEGQALALRGSAVANRAYRLWGGEGQALALRGSAVSNRAYRPWCAGCAVTNRAYRLWGGAGQARALRVVSSDARLQTAPTGHGTQL